MVTEKKSWCVIKLENDYNWWVHESSDDIQSESETSGILDPKQVEHISDMLVQLKTYGFNEEIANRAFISFAIEKEIPKEMIRIRMTKDGILNPKEGVFYLPNFVGEQEGPFLDFLDHIIQLRVKLLNSNFDFQQPLNVEEIEEILHAEQQERYISGIKVHVFDEIMSILEFVPSGYSLDSDMDDDDDIKKEDLDLSGFDDEIEDESFDGEDEKSW